MTNEIKNLIDRGALFVVNHSGGKDSQAMMIKLLDIVPRQQLLVVHATLGRVEWHGALELAQQQAADAGVPFIVARAIWKDGSAKDFLNMAERRFAARPEVPSFPSKSCRTCTSDLKRDPIDREVRRYANERGIKLIVSCEGLRAQESDDRAKLEVFTFDKRNSKAGRQVFKWLPIHELTTEEVFATIAAADQAPHWAYAAGNERLSCVFCIFGSKNDILRGAIARPELFAEYIALEEKTGYTMHMSRKSLTQIVAEAQQAIAA